MKKIIVIAWVELDGGIRTTGKYIRPDGVNYVEEIERCPKAFACVWSRKMEDLEKAEEYAKKQDRKVLILVDTEDVLDRARQIVLSELVEG